MTEKRVVILQSNYIPWKGYFDLLNAADEFIFYDNVQYTKGDWRNRNKIKTEKGLQWLTIPVGDNIKRLICEVEFKDLEWKSIHKNTIVQYYRKAPYFQQYEHILDKIYSNPTTNLSEFNQSVIKYLAQVLEARTSFKSSQEFLISGDKNNRLIEILKLTGATHYITGPSAKTYLDEELFHQEKIEIHYFDYSGYKEYPQLYQGFFHDVTILDLIFNTGAQFRNYMKTFATI